MVDMQFGDVKETLPKAFRVGPLFPKENQKKAKAAVAALKADRITYEALRKADSMKAVVQLLKEKKAK